MKYIHVFIFFFFSPSIVSQTITNYNEANGLISDFIECIAVDKINPSIIWIGTSVGLQKFDDDDYLLLSGDPVIIGIALAYASIVNRGKVNVLKWDRLEAKYYPLHINFGKED